MDFPRTTRGQQTEECVADVSPSSLGELPDWHGEVDASCDGFVVIATAPHAGTTVTVDGTRVRLLIADAAFIAVEVPKGHHVLEWRYRPPGFIAGAILSLTALVGIALAIIHPSARRQDTP